MLRGCWPHDSSSSPSRAALARCDRDGDSGTTSSTTGPSTPSKGPGGKTLVVGSPRSAKAPARRGNQFGPIGGQEARRGPALLRRAAEAGEPDPRPQRSSRRAWTRSSSRSWSRRGGRWCSRRRRRRRSPSSWSTAASARRGPVHDAHRPDFVAEGRMAGNWLAQKTNSSA